MYSSEGGVFRRGRPRSSDRLALSAPRPGAVLPAFVFSGREIQVASLSPISDDVRAPRCPWSCHACGQLMHTAWGVGCGRLESRAGLDDGAMVHESTFLYRQLLLFCEKNNL